MTPAGLSIRRPIFISSILILISILGWMGMKNMPLDLFPDVVEPTITIETFYDGAGPSEVEAQISKKMEEELSTIAGIKKISSSNKEGISIITVQFVLGVEIQAAEQDVRAKIGNIRKDLPTTMDEPIIRKVGTSDTPVMRFSLEVDLPEGEKFDLAKQKIKPRIEQVRNVGRVDILGAREREIHVLLDSKKIQDYAITASQVSKAFHEGGRNIPAGSINAGEKQTSFRTRAQYKSVDEISDLLVRYNGNDKPIIVSDIATVKDHLKDESSRTYVNGQKSILFDIYRQSGANTVAVIDAVKERIIEIEKEFNSNAKDSKSKISLKIVMDRSNLIHNNIYDVKETIIVGIILTIIVVYFFLGSLRSTFITNLALPNSLLGAFIFMNYMGFSMNTMSLLGLSVVIGLLIDDAIVVRENIYRYIEHGYDPVRAAYKGTMEVMLPVIATTAAVIAVFGPIGMLSGVVGQWFKQFGLTVVFAMAVSLFDAITIAPMLSAYFAGSHDKNHKPNNIISKLNRKMLDGFNRLNDLATQIYGNTLAKTLRFPGTVVVLSIAIFVGSLFVASKIPGTFLLPDDNGEFNINYDLPLGSGFDATDKVGSNISSIVSKDPDVDYYVTTIGNRQKEAQKGQVFVKLKKAGERKSSTVQVKDRLRGQLKEYSSYYLKVAEVDFTGGDQRQFNLNIRGNDQKLLEEYSSKIFNKLKSNPDLLDVDTSIRQGKPEFIIEAKPSLSNLTGVSLQDIGNELRTRVEGSTPAIYTQNAIDYDVRIRMQEKDRDVMENYNSIRVANGTQRDIPLSEIARVEKGRAASEILRESRANYVRISADLNPTGKGLAGAMEAAVSTMQKDYPLPAGMSFSFPGQGEDYEELTSNMITAIGLGILLIYLVLASLYESFFKPFTIMMVIPIAAVGAFFALYITNSYMDLYAMIGCVLLMGLATKNSILLLDQVEIYHEQGKSLKQSLVLAGESRLRPILMTSFAMIGGMVPIAVGLNEASKSRTGLGIVVIGGVISSTLLTLYTIPAVAIYMNRFESFFYRYFNRFVRPEVNDSDPKPQDLILEVMKEEIEPLTHNESSNNVGHL